MALELQNSENPNNEPTDGGGHQHNAAGEKKLSKDEHEEKIQKKEEHILKMEASVFQVANYYFVFQGVILTAIIKGSASSLKCHDFWLPFSLSIIGAILNFGTLLVIADKYKDSLDQLDEKCFMFYQEIYPESIYIMISKHRKKKAWRKCILVLSMILFFIFAVLNLIATWIIPCRT